MAGYQFRQQPRVKAPTTNPYPYQPVIRQALESLSRSWPIREVLEDETGVKYVFSQAMRSSRGLVVFGVVVAASLHVLYLDTDQNYIEDLGRVNDVYELQALLQNDLLTVAEYNRLQVESLRAEVGVADAYRSKDPLANYALPPAALPDYTQPSIPGWNPAKDTEMSDFYLPLGSKKRGKVR